MSIKISPSECKKMFGGIGLMILLFFPLNVFATGGISGSKLSTPCADTVPALTMEFEPYFSLTYNQKALGHDWRTQPLDHRHQGFETGFRFTIGIVENLEAGLVVPLVVEREWNAESHLTGSGLGDVPVGLKWRLLSQPGWALAWHGGVTFPTGIRGTTDVALPTGNGSTAYESGIVLTLSATNHISIDANIQMGLNRPERSGETQSLDLGLDLAIGYVFNTFQLVVELNQTHGFWQNHMGALISMHVGFTWEINERVIIVTGPRFDLAGKNQTQAVAYNLAFTILL